MTRVKSENYIMIQGWMVSELHLKGNELLVYAIIYGFSQAEGQKFTGSLQYLADWTNASKQGVKKNLVSLVEKGLLIKEDRLENGVKFCSYYATEFNRVYNNVAQGMQQSLTGYATEFKGGMQQSLTNNITNKLDNKLDNSIEDRKEHSSKKKPPKHRYGSNNNVLLTDDELEKLKEQFPDTWDEKIEDLSYYMGSYGKTYKSHYLTILNWARKDKKKQSQAPKANKTAQMLDDSYAMMAGWADSE